MVTGCSTADLAVILVDARTGVARADPPAHRHRRAAAASRGSSWPSTRWTSSGSTRRSSGSIADEIESFAGRLGVTDVTAIPVSALRGDNVVERSTAMPWFDGPPVLDYLESVPHDPLEADGPLRLPIQWVIRAAGADDPDYRAYAGRIEGGRSRPGDAVVALPSGIATRVASIDTYDGPLAEASAPLSVAVRLTDDVDLGRGGLLAGADDVPLADRASSTALVCWLGDAPFSAGRRYRLAHTTAPSAPWQPRSSRGSTSTPWNTTPTRRRSSQMTSAASGLTLAEPIFADPLPLEPLDRLGDPHRRDDQRDRRGGPGPGPGTTTCSPATAELRAEGPSGLKR